MNRSPSNDATELAAFKELEEDICHLELLGRLQAYLVEMTISPATHKASETELQLMEFVAFMIERATTDLKRKFLNASEASQ